MAIKLSETSQSNIAWFILKCKHTTNHALFFQQDAPPIVVKFCVAWDAEAESLTIEETLSEVRLTFHRFDGQIRIEKIRGLFQDSAGDLTSAEKASLVDNFIDITMNAFLGAKQQSQIKMIS